MTPNELIYGLVLAENLEYLYPFFIFVELNYLQWQLHEVFTSVQTIIILKTW